MVYTSKFIFTLAIFYFLTYIPFVFGYIYKYDEYTVGTFYALMSFLVGLLWFLGLERLIQKIINIYK